MKASQERGDAQSETGVATQIPYEDRRELYEYVYEHGPVDRAQLQQELFPSDVRAFRHNLSFLIRRGLLEETDDRVEIAVDLTSLADTKTVELAGQDEPVTLRPAQQNDRTELVDLIKTVSENGVHVEAEDIGTSLLSDGDLQRQGEDGVSSFYVAAVDGTLCGWVHLRTCSRTKLLHTASLTGGVAETYRENGIGTHLLEYAVDWAESHGYSKLYQNLPAKNQAGIDFLTERGWTIEATRDDHYVIEDAFVDEIILSCSFDL